MTIFLPTILNDESELSETSVAAWTISYDIGYMSSSTSSKLEHWNAINSTTHTESNFFFLFCPYMLTKFDTRQFVKNQMAEPENQATQYEFPNEGSEN
jgi:hypothetical protein